MTVLAAAYEIISLVGAAGMGEYDLRSTTLRRSNVPSWFVT